MSVEEMQAAVPSLSIDELHRLEEVIHQAYRQRQQGIIFDDAYGVWTEEDQVESARLAWEEFDD